MLGRSEVSYATTKRGFTGNGAALRGLDHMGSASIRARVSSTVISVARPRRRWGLFTLLAGTLVLGGIEFAVFLSDAWRQGDWLGTGWSALALLAIGLGGGALTRELWRLRQLRRTVGMLESELRQGNLDEALLADIDAMLEQGLGTDPRSSGLRGHVDALRESTLTPRPEFFRDTIRACEKLKDAIEGVLNDLG